MDKQPYQLTYAEFNSAFPFFTDLTPRTKWRCYRLHNKTCLQEVDEECTYEEFLEFAPLFRWDKESATTLISNEHSHFIQQALKFGWDVPADVLAECPDMVEEFIQKRAASKRLQQKRTKHHNEEREARRMNKEDEKFWSNF